MDATIIQVSKPESWSINMDALMVRPEVQAAYTQPMTEGSDWNRKGSALSVTRRKKSNRAGKKNRTGQSEQRESGVDYVNQNTSNVHFNVAFVIVYIVLAYVLTASTLAGFFGALSYCSHHREEFSQEAYNGLSEQTIVHLGLFGPSILIGFILPLGVLLFFYIYYTVCELRMDWNNKKYESD